MLIPKHHSLAEANQLVPLLEESFAEIQRHVLRLQAARIAIGAATASDEEPDPGLTREVDDAEARIEDEVHTLLRMGVLVPSVVPPEVHLLSHRGASPVVLSWQPGEPAFLHWHSLDWGFAERAPIDHPELFGDPVLPS